MNMDSYKRCVCRPVQKAMTVKLNADTAEQLKIAAVSSKREILLLLGKTPHCVCDLITHTKLSQTLISHHLSDLADAGLAKSEKNGAFVDYSLTNKGRKLVGVIKKLNS